MQDLPSVARPGSIVFTPPMTRGRRATAAFHAAVAILRRNWRWGSLTFHLPSGQQVRVEGGEPGPAAVLLVRDFRFVRRVLAGGDIGLGEGFMAGEWDTPDLAVLLKALSRNLDGLMRLMNGAPLVRIANRWLHALNRNDRKGSRRNIEAHYDLGNAFYERWLDPTMTYSSAMFDRPNQPLAEAQRNKYAALARAVGLQPGHKVLEIGCGWGGFAEFASAEVGAHVTGVTLSREQHDFARARLGRQGLSGATDIRLMDYRDVEGQFDRIVSIEMLEAVGEAYWPQFFGKLQSTLVPGGRAGVQVITIEDRLFPHYRGQADFIQKYVFPGGMLPSNSRLEQETVRAGLRWGSLSRFGQHYADTLAQWAHRFLGAWDDISRLGFDERFRRLWLFYLAYCEAGFDTGRIDVVQFTAAKA